MSNKLKVTNMEKEILDFIIEKGYVTISEIREKTGNFRTIGEELMSLKNKGLAKMRIFHDRTKNNRLVKAYFLTPYSVRLLNKLKEEECRKQKKQS